MKLLTKNFSLYKNKYPVFIDNRKRKIVYLYGKFKLLDEKTKSFIKNNDTKINYKIFDEENPIVTFILTRDCNMRCRYCSVHAGEHKEKISFETIKTALDHIYKNKPKKAHIIFFGGEPTLEMDLIRKTVKYAESFKIPTRFAISTNGLTNDNVVKYLAKKRFIINLSVDGIPEFQDSLRPSYNGGPTSNVIEKTIKELVKHKATFKTRSTVVNKSVNSMLDAMIYFNKLGVTHVHFEPLNICGRADNKNLKMPPLKTFLENYKKCINYAAKHKMKIVNGVYDNLFSPSYDYCDAATGQKLVITPDGLITRCYEIQDDQDKKTKVYIVGKIQNNKILFDKDKVKEMNKVLKLVRKSCQNCFAKYLCSSGCTIRTYRHIIDKRFSLDYRCNLAKEIIADAILRLWKEQGEKIQD
ncbi:MAG: radical SAM protein [Candidatus Moranbacteria bacterium]|nr:radical SAM protein [Candidatus Moranbacteria bacterium]